MLTLKNLKHQLKQAESKGEKLTLSRKLGNGTKETQVFDIIGKVVFTVQGNCSPTPTSIDYLNSKGYEVTK